MSHPILSGRRERWIDARRIAGCLVGAACWLGALAAHADPGNEPWASSSGETGAGLGLVSPQGGLFWAEGGFFTGNNVTAFSPIVGLGFFVTPDVELELMLPTVFASVDFGPNDDSAFRVGQPYLGVNYVHSDGPLRFKIGGGIAWMPDDVDSLAAGAGLGTAAGMRGWWDPWLWDAQDLSLVGPFRLEYDLGDVAVFGLDAGVGIMIETDGNDGDDDVDLAFQVGPGFGFRLSEAWLFGFRFAGVFIPTRGGDNEQFSFEPYIRGAFGPGFFLARITMNLDNPYGWSFDDGGVWGIHAGGGFAW